MPELPEVETIRCQLSGALPGRRVAALEKLDAFMLRQVRSDDFAAAVVGRHVLSVGRRGKFLLVNLSDDWVVTIHLGMTGQLLLVPPRDGGLSPTGTDTSTLDPSPHDRFVFLLGASGESSSADPEPGAFGSDAPNDGSRLVFRDMRKFGRVELSRGGPAPRVDTLGPDAWPGADWTTEDLAAMFRGRTAPLKAVLLDQRRLAGIGNIYADEILFAARLSPVRPAGSLSTAEVASLAEQIPRRLGDGVDLHGCSIKDFVDTGGWSGRFQRELRAYGRHGLPCTACGTPLERVVVGGRGTAYCPRCQQ